MITFDTPDYHRYLYEGEHRIWHITDRVWLSAISHYYSIGGRDGLWEVAVLVDGRPDRNHPLFQLGHLHLSEVIQHLDDLQKSLLSERQLVLS